MWIEVDVTCRLQDDMYAWDLSARKSLRRDRPQASRSRHRRAGRPVLSPLIPGCSVAGDQDPGSGPYFVMITDPSSADQEHALAEQGEGSSAEGLALEHLEPVDVALDGA